MSFGPGEIGALKLQVTFKVACSCNPPVLGSEMRGFIAGARQKVRPRIIFKIPK